MICGNKPHQGLNVQHRYLNKYFLRERPLEGQYLHLSGEGLTEHSKYAWIGTWDQLKHLLKNDPSLRSMTIVKEHQP